MDVADDWERLNRKLSEEIALSLVNSQAEEFQEDVEKITIHEKIASAIRDFRTIYPLPHELSANLKLAAEAASKLKKLEDELFLAIEEVGLPAGASVRELIAHHRGNAGLAVAVEMLAASYEVAASESSYKLAEAQSEEVEPASEVPEVPLELTSEEWREFQAIPEQGYSHRAWVDHKIAQRVEAALAQRLS